MFTHVYRSSERRILGCLLTLAILLAATVMAAAQSSPFAPGWDLDPDRSNIRFQSIKNTKDGMKVESSTFATFTGEIDPSGSAEVKVLLDSVDTLVDLRNVRMRFLFFETFLYPEATISLELTEDMIADLPASRRTTINLPYIFDLHGVQIPMQSLVTVTMLNDDQVSVASAVPISIEAVDFGLAENITKLEEAVGGITIIPSATVTFDFLFARRGSDAAPSGSEPDPGSRSDPRAAVGGTGTRRRLLARCLRRPLRDPLAHRQHLLRLLQRRSAALELPAARQRGRYRQPLSRLAGARRRPH